MDFDIDYGGADFFNCSHHGVRVGIEQSGIVDGGGASGLDGASCEVAEGRNEVQISFGNHAR